jgi:uncharacterized protein YdeI (YjbR/CyaY-like superfamily)
MPAVKPIFFDCPRAFRAWLASDSAAAREVLVGFHKRGTGLPSMTWPESVDEALCFGWIDGVRKRIDDARYQIRFSPRKPGSIWSLINIDRVRVLTKEGRMTPAGLTAFAQRSGKKLGIYSYEQPAISKLAAAEEKCFRSHKAAWEFFEKQAPSYRKTAIWRIVNARQEKTRQKRLAALIKASENSRRI